MRILFLDLDTLRSDHLGCYGYHRNTSPNLDRIASEGVRFDNYYCSDAPCLPSRTALMSGRFGVHTGVVGHGGTAADMRLEGAGRGFGDLLRRDSLPGTLRKAGLRTVTISPFADRHSSWTFLAGFSEMHDPAGRCGAESAEEITPRALQWIQTNAAQDDWFLHINYWDPHTPYRAPEAFGNPFAEEPLPAWLTEQVVADHQQAVGPHTAREVSMYGSDESSDCPRQPGEVRNMDDARRLIDGYDCGIAYMDQHIGRLLDALAEQGVLDDLMIIVSSDHGENMGELGIYSEHATADHTTCRIPMIIRGPGVVAGRADAGLHYNLDLLPTLAEFVDVTPADRWDGASYAETLRSGGDAGRDELVISQCAHVCQRSVRWDQWLYMRTYHDGFHLFADEMLFDIEADPHEQHDLAASQPEVCREGQRRLMRWHDEMMQTQPAGYDTDPMQTVLAEGGPLHARGQLARYCQRLEQTDRGWAVQELRRRHPGEFV